MPGAQGFQQSSPVGGPQAGGQEQFSNQKAPQVEKNDPFYQQKGHASLSITVECSAKNRKRVDGLSSFSILALFLGESDRWQAGYFWTSSETQADAKRTRQWAYCSEKK